MPFSTGYQEIKLGDVLDIRDGTHDTPKYVESGIPLITSKNLTDSGISFQDISYISECDHDEISKRSAVENGDILYGMIGTIGKPTLVDTERVFSIKNVALFKQSNPEIHNRYLLRLLSSSAINQQIARASKGGTQKFVGLGALRNLRATFPPLPEQRRIAAILNQADALRAKRREALAQLDSLTQSIFVEMFGDPLSNSKNLPLSKLIEVSSFENGDRSSNYPSGDDIKDSGVLFLSTKNISNGRLDLTSCSYITREKFDSLTRGKARKNDILITLRGTLGSCCIFDCTHDTAFINAQMMIVRPNAHINPLYLHALLASPQFRALFARIGQGAAVPQLTAAQLSQLQIPVPSETDQFIFESRIQALSAIKRHQEHSLAELEALFASLQNRAFRGEL